MSFMWSFFMWSFNNRDEQHQGEIDSIISKFKYHPSILQIQQKVSIYEAFEFRQVDEEEVFKQLTSLDIKKATTFQNIPCKSLRDNAEVCTPVLTNIINNDLTRKFSFSDKLSRYYTNI